MSVFNEIGQKISNSSQLVAKKTKNLTEVARHNILISEENKKIEQLFGKLGQEYYNKFGASPDGELDEVCSEIRDCFTKIESYSEEIKKIQSARICPSCGAECPSDIAFCGNCGKKLQ